MDIKPGKKSLGREFAEVTFDNAEELHKFGDSAPTFSAAYNRELRYFSYGLWPGPRFPETFPAELRMPESVLARTAGNLMLGGVGVLAEEIDLRNSMIETISSYFTQSSPAEIERLTAIGRQIVDDYAARRRANQSDQN